MIRLAAFAALMLAGLTSPPSPAATPSREHWTGTWATAAQPTMPGRLTTFENQSVRLIVHVSIGGPKLRVRLSNLYGDQPLVVGAAHVARRTQGADTLPGTDRVLKFGGKGSVTLAAHDEVWSDAVALEVPALSDLAITLYLPGTAPATTAHTLALQTNYVSASGDATGAKEFPVAKTISIWPFLTGVDVASSRKSAAIVAFGSSLTDGDGSTEDANRRYPDYLAARLQKAFGNRFGVLNEGMIGNRMLHDSPRASPFGPLLGEPGLARFDRDVLGQSGVKHVIIALGVNDIIFPAFPFVPAEERVTSADLVAAYRQLIMRAHARGVRAIGTTMPPFEGAKFEAFDLSLELYTPERERIRTEVNEWVRRSGEFDAVLDFDAVVRDPARPTQLLPKYASEDRIHANDAGNAAQAAAIALEVFD